MMQPSSQVWAIVLAGGSGSRLAGITAGVPKQFCGFGGRTLLEDTIDRIAPIVDSGRTSVVVDRAHEPYLRAVNWPGPVRLLHQPRNRGTAAGVLFGLLPAIGSGCDPIVVLTPSDHGVTDEVAFQDSIRDAVEAVASGGYGVVLFGAEPSEPDGDYGWISPAVAPRGDSGFVPVDSFVEKPSPQTAANLFEKRAVWNTMVIVARLSVLLDLYRRHLPHLVRTFAGALQVSEPARTAFLERHYESLTVADFCRDVLMQATGLWVRIWPAAVGWSDLGTPERLRRWMASAGETDWITGRSIESEGSYDKATMMPMEAMS
ncbi:MAG: sugar phosphate nucleotidyltransferase [Vicinamibacterales bacterium]